MAWYDLFSTFYDGSVEFVYRSVRPQVAAELQLQPGDHVLDLACGTGPNHPHLMQAITDSGKLFGVDFSEGMLRRAKKAGEKNGWTNLYPLQRDARELTIADLEEASGGPVHLDAILVTLGLSVIPDWETVLRNTFGLLKPGGRYVIFDVFAQRWVPQSWLVKHLAQADLYRESWKLLEELSDSFSFQFLPGSPHIHGGRPFLATGCRAVAP